MSHETGPALSQYLASELKTRHQETLSAGSDARGTIEKLVTANRETTEAAVEAARAFAASNPWAESVRRGFESFGQAAGTAPQAQPAAV